MIDKNNLLGHQAVQKRYKLVPPDGGWGWMVLIGAATTNIFNQSMLSLFSLLYGDALEAMGHKTQGAAIILSTMLFICNFGGPIAGVLLKLTSPRFVAVTGSCLCTVGIFFSGFSTNIVHLIFSYGVLLGMGLGFIQNSTFVAINTYFKLKKSRAVGLANVGTGVGQTLMPHLVRYLLENYGFRGACLLLSSLSLHGICGTLLIQPVHWHLKKVEEDVAIDEKLHLLSAKNENSLVRKDIITRRATEPAIGVVNGLENTKVDTMTRSYKELNDLKLNGFRSKENGVNGQNNNVEEVQNKSIFRKIYDLFDVSLLSNPRFINIIIGTALAVTSIQNFSMLYPFFLQKVASLNKHQTAVCMSAIASADIAGRLILPIFQDKYRIKARWMLIMTSIWLIVVRQILAYQSDFKVLIAMSCIYGFGRSMVIVARNIAISEEVRMEQVPAAVGLGMLTMGIIVPPAGYFLGWIRDFTGSYIICITAQNMLLVILLVMWIPDMLLLWIHERKQNKNSEQMQMS